MIRWLTGWLRHDPGRRIMSCEWCDGLGDIPTPAGPYCDHCIPPELDRRDGGRGAMSDRPILFSAPMIRANVHRCNIDHAEPPS